MFNQDPLNTLPNKHLRLEILTDPLLFAYQWNFKILPMLISEVLNFLKAWDQFPAISAYLLIPPIFKTLLFSDLTVMNVCAPKAKLSVEFQTFTIYQ